MRNKLERKIEEMKEENQRLKERIQEEYNKKEQIIYELESEMKFFRKAFNDTERLVYRLKNL